MEHDYRERIYQNYLATLFGYAHNPDEIQADYRRYYRYFAKNYKKYLPEDISARILDAGCGLGHFLYFVTQLGYTHVTGVDLSEELVAFCKSQHFDVRVAEISTFLTEHPDTFDLIVCNDVFEHLRKHEVFPLLDAIYLALKKGGRIIVNTPNMNNPITGLPGRYIAFDHEVGFTESSLRQVLLLTQFQDIRIFGHDGYVFYENPLNYLAKCAAFLTSKLFYLLSWMYGRNSLKIYDKNIIAVAYKQEDNKDRP